MWRVLAAASIALSGCQFMITGLYSNDTPHGSAGGAADAPPDAGAAPVDLLAAPDFATAADPCGASGALDGNSLGATCAIGAAPHIDGVLDEWAGRSFLNLTHAN